MDVGEILWTPDAKIRITDVEGRAAGVSPSPQPVPRISRVRITVQVGKDQSIVTMATEGLRGRWVWSRRVALVLLPIGREEVGALGPERLLLRLIDRIHGACFPTR